MTSFTEQLSAIPLLSGCSAVELQRLASAADDVTVGAGTELTTEGAIGREAFVLLDGEVEILKDGERVAALGPGDHFGELALLDGGPRTATAVARTEARLLVLTKPAFHGVLDEIPTLTHKLLVSLAHRLRAAEQSPHN